MNLTGFSSCDTHDLTSKAVDSAGSRPRDKEGTGHPDPQVRGGGAVSKKTSFQPFGSHLSTHTYLALVKIPVSCYFIPRIPASQPHKYRKSCSHLSLNSLLLLLFLACIPSITTKNSQTLHPVKPTVDPQLLGVRVISDLKQITRNKQMDGEGMLVSCTLHLKDSKRYRLIFLERELSNSIKLD